MALEKLWRQILPVDINGLGPKAGSLLVQDSTEFKVGMEVTLRSVGHPDLLVEIKEINKNTIYFKKIGAQNQAYEDVSLYASGTIQSSEQVKKAITQNDQSLDRYERGPINADRSVLVDRKGEFYSVSNPLEVRLSDGNVNIGTVNAELEVQLSHKNNFSHPGDIADSVRIGNGTNELNVNSDGSINVNANISATNLDIRNLSAPTDNVAISDGTNIVTVTSANALKVDGSAVTQPISGNVIASISGTPTVNIGTIPEVEIKNDSGNPIPVSGFVTASQGTSPWVISGNVTANIGTMPEVEIKNDSGNPVPISGSVIATISGTPTVNIGTIPEVEIKNDSGNPIPVNGTITANIGTTNGLALDSTLTSGSQKSIVRGGSKGSTISADVTSTNVDVNTQALDVSVKGTPSVSVSNFPAIQPISGTVTSNQGTNPWVISGNVTATISGTPTVNIGTIPEVEIKNDSGNPIPVSGNITVTPNPNSFTYVKYIGGINSQLDSTGRLRVAVPGQQYWYTPAVDKDGDLRYIESFSGTGASSSFVQNLASVSITSGNTNTGSAIRASRRRHKMRPGVGMQWFSTHNFNGVQTNVTKRRGLFTNYNGFFFEVTDDLYFVIRRRLIEGTLVEERIKRTSFDNDKLDGTGPSGFNFGVSTTYNITSYVSKTTKVISATESHYNVVFTTTGTAPFRQGTKVLVTGLTPTSYNGIAMVISVSSGSITLNYISDPGTFTSGTGVMTQTAFMMNYTWTFDFEGDRTNRLRIGMLTSEGTTELHSFKFDGLLGTNFSNAPALMDRTEIFNTGAVDYTPTLIQSSSAINIEAESELSPGFGTASNNNGITFNKSGTQEFAILGIGLRAGEPYQRGDLQVQSLQIMDITNVNPQNSGVMYYRLVLNPTITGGDVTPINIGKTSRYWKYTASTTWTGGIELLSGYSTQSTMADVKTSLNFLNLGSNIEYTDADKIVLFVKHLAGGNADPNIVATINFIESL